MCIQFGKCKVRCKSLNIFLYFVYCLFSCQVGFTIKERMYEKICFKSHNTKRPNINSLSELLCLIKQQLRCPIYYSPCNLIGCLLHRRCTKICNLEYTFRIDDIFGFDITMDDFLLMNAHQSMCNIDQHLNILILNEMVHLYLVSQRELTQLKQDVNIVANYSE